MRSNLGFLSTKVGRRSLRAFLLAALLPVLVVSIASLWFVRDTLERSASDRVGRSVKSLSLFVLGNLTAASDRNTRGSGTEPVSDDSFPPLDDDQLAHLAAGGVVVRLSGTEAQNEVADANVSLWRLGADGDPVGQLVRPAQLWANVDELLVGDSQQYCVFAVGTWQRVHCTEQADTDLVQAMLIAAREGRSIAGPRIADGFVLAHRDLYLRFQFAGREWRVVAAEPQSEVFAPVLTIVRSLVVFLLLALVAAFVLAHRHIRHATRPLEALRDATRRVASGDLETPVAITSSDEYGELASAFDVMTGELGRQFRLMRSLEAVDEATLRERKVHAIAEVAVSRFIGDESCSRVVLVLVDPDARNRALRWQLDSAEPRIQSEAVRLTEAELARLGELPRASVCSSAALPAICEAAATPAFGTDARVVLPLQQNGRLLGILVLAFRSTPEIGSAAVLSARRIADRITLGISNVRLLEHVSSLSEGALLAFARAIDANSHWTAGHSERVTAVALQLGRTLHLDQYALETLARGGIMHDVGKIGIPTAVIDKNGRLTNAERAVIEQHPLIGETILKPISALSDALPIVRSHHEKWDGTGYPDRLAGEDIPWLARILAAADVLDALTSDRPYRVGMSVDDAVRIITDGSGTHFDPRVVEALRSLDRDRLLAPFATNTVSVLPNAAASSHELIFASAL